MTFEEISMVIAPLVGVGFLLGCIPVMIGLGVNAVINIFKKI